MTKVLIVDDDPFDRGLIANSLRKMHSDVQICEVSDARTVGAQLEGFAPDIMLLDIAMEPVNGFDVLRRMAQGKPKRPKSVIMLSGSTNPADKATSQRLGADGYLVKPSSLEGYDRLAAEIF